ncbi:MAG: hypothetical protein ACR2G7_09770 [Acidimicrobiales bacterium]
MRLQILPARFERATQSTQEPEGDEPLTEVGRWFAERAPFANTRRAYRADFG